ncbi:MAG TPA: PEP/pyruvate-binding domain-containing protein [Gaiellales bacterium]|nr:PEP/pyruvate-binding domain-containing protein [Gaiellales bacterium]
MDAAAGIAPLPLAAAADAGETAVGGKAMGLARLVALGLPVPDAVVLPVGWAGGDDDLAAAARGLRPPFAVRSSAVGEDSSGRSAAGQFETVSGVRDVAGLGPAVARCLASAASPRAEAYAGETASMAVVIQHQVGAGRSGVAFSVDPVSGRRDEVVVEAVFGHGEGIVGGLVSPDRYRISDAGAVRARRAQKPVALEPSGRRRRLPSERQAARTLRDDEAVAVARLARQAEAGFGGPVDVEFCYEGARLWLLQCRPVTALGAA